MSAKKLSFWVYIKVHFATAMKTKTPAQTIGIFHRTGFVHTIAGIAT
jgi:hypothetical protein